MKNVVRCRIDSDLKSLQVLTESRGEPEERGLNNRIHGYEITGGNI